jgi:iron complex transport system substrate-binding protein
VKRRIVSLLPSATEIVCALGLQDALVGRSHECDFPPGVERLPVLTRAKMHGKATREIHDSVAAILREDISVYSVDADLLRDLQPTHIVTQIQCDVCAVSLRNVEAAIADWSGVAPAVIPLNPQSLNDVFEDIQRTAKLLDVDSEPLISCMRSRMTPRTSAHRPTVVVIEWIEPLMAAGNWMPELVSLAGGTSLLGRNGSHSDWIRWNDLVAADPDVIVIAPCGFRIEDSQRDMHLLTSNPKWRSLRAVQHDRVFIVDGSQYFNRPGPRLAESLDILREIVH